MPFDDGFLFAATNITLVLQHAGGKFLRVNPDNDSQADANGGKGGFAQWIIEGNGDVRKFKNKKTGRYLRIMNNKVDVGGGGGPWTTFKVHGTGNERKLESTKETGRYIAVRNGKVVTGNGGPFTLIKFFRNPIFSSRYLFAVPNVEVVIQHKGGRFLRVGPNNDQEADADGGKGGLARWIVEGNGDVRKFKNKKTGRYLRIMNGKVDVGGSGGPWTTFKIHGKDNERKLESTKLSGTYIAVRNGNVVTGTGGPFCVMNFFKDA